ncbi:amidohydrolase family protein [Egibacter rhizosphaerae]|uniref:Amidohydrolase family protein n=1 Tax=Egibacter rhizosphaerae TaxID=1670831 RepID=A0A411YHX5_9ACTN|nr:amidohydrolase family protein [Egibacter rhizosphaerae]QBI20840.1 amidohydrolase family protein [Egibacter rhizosphaerae]
MVLTLDGPRLFDPVRGRISDPVAVAISDDRIDAVGPAAARRDTPTVDLDGMVALPGLIEAHAHLGIVGPVPDFRTPAAVTAALIFRNCALALEAGFTTARDCGGVDGGVAQAIARGHVRGPRLLPSGPMICQTGGHGDLSVPYLGEKNDVYHSGIPGLVKPSMVCDGPDEVREAARKAFQRGATQLKLAVSGGVISHTDRLEDAQFTVDELRAAVTEAQARGRYVTVHAHNRESITQALDAGVSCIEHGTFLDDALATEMARQGAAMVPTLSIGHLLQEHWQEWGAPEEAVGRAQQMRSALRQALKSARGAGVLMGLGSDLIGAEQSGRGLEIRLRAEMTDPLEALTAATLHNATIIGQADDLGTVEPGKIADLVVVDGDPLENPALLEDPESVVLVIQAGQIVKDLTGRMTT